MSWAVLGGPRPTTRKAHLSHPNVAPLLWGGPGSAMMAAGQGYRYRHGHRLRSELLCVFLSRVLLWVWEELLAAGGEAGAGHACSACVDAGGCTRYRLLRVCFIFVVSAVYDCTLNFRNDQSPTLLGVLSGKKYHADMYVR